MGIKNNVIGMYSKIIRGLNGYPKMSKSLPGSAITANMTPSEILDIILSEQDNFEHPEDSVVFQLMASVSDYGCEELKEIYNSAILKNNKWELYKRDYAFKLSEYCSKWN